MPFKSTTYKLRLYNKILYANTIAESPCFNYKTKNHECFIMLDSNLKCAKCVRLGQSYVNMSQTSLDKTYKEYKKKVKEDKKELSVIITQLLQNKKILVQAKERACKKTLCFTIDIEAEGKTVNAILLDCSAADALIDYSFIMQVTLSMLDNFTTISISLFLQVYYILICCSGFILLQYSFSLY